MASLRDLLEETRKRLVETGTRNRLVHVNRSAKRANVLNIINERSDDIFQILRINNKKMRFSAKGSEDEANDEISLALDFDEEFDESRYKDLLLETPLTSDALQKRLLRLANNARIAEEEQGINILFFCLGFLRWYEDTKSEVLRESPLILVPVELVRNERFSTFDIRCRDDDIITNLPLQERLKIDFGIDLTEIDDSEEWTPSEYFSEVSKCISGQTRWSIDCDGMQLGFFSFAKLLMLRDLDPDNWDENTLLENVLVSGLLSEGFESELGLFKEDANLDQILKPDQIFHVVDADASQTKVIEEVNSGRNLVVQGPPGTGKSQTITNILAAAAHKNKTVLFIAEKMAALNVVHQRMLNAGLGDLCLELHSRSANKKAFLDELAKTLSNGRRSQVVSDDTSDLESARTKLNLIVDSLHSPYQDMDYSPFTVLSILINYVGRNISPPKLDFSSLLSISISEEKNICEELSRYIEILRDNGIPKENAFSGTTQLELQPPDLQRLADELDIAIEAINTWQSTNQVLAKHLLKDSSLSLEESIYFEKIVRNLTSMPTGIENILGLCHAYAREPRFIESLQIGHEWKTKKEHFSDTLLDSIWTQSLDHLRPIFVKGMNSWISRIFGKYRKASSELSTFLRIELPKLPKERLELIDSIIESQSKKKEFDTEEQYLKQKLMHEWRGDKTDFRSFKSTVEWLCDVERVLLDYSFDEIQAVISDKEIKKIDVNQIEKLREEVLTTSMSVINRLGLPISSSHDFLTIDINAVISSFQAMLDKSQDYDIWVKLTYLTKTLENRGLGKLLQEIESKNIKIDDAEDEFLYGLYESRWNHIRENRPILKDISRTDRHKIVEQFRSCERKRISDVQKIIRFNHLAQLPQGSAGEMGLIRGEIAKKRRHKPIRQVVNYAGSMIQRIKPIFLMSPISVAQFLPPGKVSFDLLVIDEASQVRPEDALGSIARASQIVVVGDQKQLPPTTFFDRLTDNIDTNEGDDEDSDELPTAKAIEMESILSLCEARGIKSSMLEWHYRSRDPSLITVSNIEFYANGLILPPCPTQLDDEFGLSLTRVEGEYSSAKKGTGRPGTNRIEAECIANRLSNIATQRPEFSVGVVTFSKAQADMVTEVLELRRRENANLDDLLKENKYENTFVKNIENVQGDERDIILISVGYGPHEKNGNLPNMHFGPINSEGGERRLNVLFSRSRIACEVFSSFDPGDIDLSRTTKRGPRVLKRFLEFAKTGQIDEMLPSGKSPDSPFEEDVAREIQALGFQVDYQVGTAGFKIDLGVKSKKNSGHYILAVECDGATYHSALWARERDRMRQEVLEGHGWIFHRIWSTDWFYRRIQEIERLSQALEIANDRDTSTFVKGANQDLPSHDKSSTNSSIPIDRVSIDITPKEIEVPVYKKARIRINSLKEPHELPTSKIAEILCQIISVEGPIHFDELARRYAEAFEKSRVGGRISKSVKNGLNYAKKNNKICQSEKFWGTQDQFYGVSIRDRSKESLPLTKPDYISREEIIACSNLIDKESGSMDIEEKIKTISRILGFKRAGPDFQKRVKDIFKN